MKRAASASADPSPAAGSPSIQVLALQGASQAPSLYSITTEPCSTAQSDVFAAVKKGDAAALLGMMATGLINPTAIDPASGMSALMLAALRGHTYVVTILTRGTLAAHIDLQDARSNTALSLAEAAGHAGVVEILRTRGAGGNGLPAGGLVASEPVLTASATVIRPGGAPVSHVVTTTASAATSASMAQQSTQADMRPITEILFDAIERNDPDALRAVLTQVAVQAAADAENILATIKRRRLTDIDIYCTPLMAAAWLGHAHMVETLMRAGAEPDQQNVDGLTALMAAARQGYTEIVQTLLRAGVEVDRITLHDKTDCDLWHGYPSFGCNPHPYPHLLYDTYPFRSGPGVIVQRAQTVFPFCGRGKPPWVADWTALVFAARNGHTETVQALLQGGASVDKTACDGATALIDAVEHGHTATAQVLLLAGAKVDQTTSDGATALMYAANYGHTATLQMLLHAGAKVNQATSRGITALTTAASQGCIGNVQALLRAGATVDQAISEGWTALMCAAKNGHTSTVQALLQAGANVAHAMPGGKTALMFAAEYGDTPTVLALLEGGAGVEQTTAHGSTALMYAAQSGRTANVLALLQGGADVDQISSDGFTALMYAADKGHTAAAQMLLWGDANCKFRNNDGDSALSLARSGDHQEVIKLLNDYGANSIFSFASWFG